MSKKAQQISGVKYTITGQLPGTGKDAPSPDLMTTVDQTPFSPNQPLQPVFQDGMRGRQFDFMTGYNLNYVPRQEEPISFSQLRGLAERYDLLRVCLETCKDQITKLDWCIKPKDPKKKEDARCKGIEDFLRYPDKEHDWQTWLRMLLEDMLVIDAATVYPRPTKSGSLYALELIDGSLIKRSLDGTGRTPACPDVAYQQYIKGVPAVDYCRPDMDTPGIIRHDLGGGKTIDEILYCPRNLRTHKVYGMGPVEQIIMTVNIALRRQLHQLQYYTEGSMPDLIFTVPPEWNTEQIRQMQEYWDSLMVGNTAERRHSKFISHGVEPYDIKQHALKDEYDDWLARIVCFTLSLPPTPFIKQMNRAVAETQKEQATEEGYLPRMSWTKSVLDKIIWKYFNYPDLEFAWQDAQETDPNVQAEIDKIYLQEYVIGPNEVRDRLGMVGNAPEKPLGPMVGQPMSAECVSSPSLEKNQKTDGTIEKVERLKKKWRR
jgi:hypothetical protein